MHRRQLALALLVVTALAACSSGGEPPRGAVPSSANANATAASSADSAPRTSAWVCRPGGQDAPCTTNLDATVVRAGGIRSRQRITALKQAKADCFYVYPTVSQAPADNAPLTASPEVVAAVRDQAALFSSACRVFAPLYRQVTLRSLLSGHYLDKQAQQTAYDDVRAAWRDYLAHDNHGRRFVLIGHSQGAMVLRHLVQEEIDRKPQVRRLLLSAILLGGNVTVPVGRDVGADFTAVPACRRAGQTGCVIAYSSFASTPPADSFFGRTSTPGRRVLCTDPSALAGGSGTVTPYVPADRVTGGPAALPGTAFVAYPNAVRVSCHQAGGADWLQVAPAPHAVLPPFQEQLGPRWGLHIADVTLALGDLVEAVRRQIDAA